MQSHRQMLERAEKRRHECVMKMMKRGEVHKCSIRGRETQK